MLDIRFIRENVELVKTAVVDKNLSLDIDQLLKLDAELRNLKSTEQDLNTKKNLLSKQIPKSSNEERPQFIAESKEIGNQLSEIRPRISELEKNYNEIMLLIPNIPSPLAPKGKDESDNIEVKKWGDLPVFDFTPLDHVELLEKNQWAEFERVAKVCGSRSYSLKNEMLFLELSLHRLAMDLLRKKGFNLFSTPSLSREEALVGTGHFPSGKDQVYYLPEDNLYLSGTAEVQLNSLYSNEIFSEEDLPLLMAGYSSCFRREAGSYGRDVRGLIRVHQFTKVEQYIICKNSSEEAEKWHKTLLETSEEIMKLLELPYRVVECCTGDMGTGKVRMYDVEAWVPSEKTYRETHSCSNLHDWQARRTMTRFRDKEGKVQYCYTLNNTAVATPRILVPFLENHQQKNGKIKIPKALRPYLGGQEILG